MSIKERLKTDMIAAMKSKEKEKLDTIRMIQASIKRQEVDTRVDLDDAAITAILTSQVKQRKDSIDQFRKGGREELAQKEESELKIVQSYLPAQLSEAELTDMVMAAIKETGATGMKDMSGVIKAVMAKAGAAAEGGVVSGIVKKKLSSS
ncbi:MAG: GatB/YqeY domain-containing protein [Proteobacteria bacterium]|nr:MAG: GatB/YqeY domain-containing protein [Pseudomonadota bacterium]